MPATLSQIRAWSTEHLVDAAGFWTKTADQWEDVFLQMRNQSYAIAWQGAGGDALRERTSADLPIVSAKADQLRQAAMIARNGVSDISAVQRRVLYAVEGAQNAGFTVGEDLSVTDTRTSATAAEQAARQAQAEGFAGDIRTRAIQLEGADLRVAGELTTATAHLGTVVFTPSPNPSVDQNGDGDRRSTGDDEGNIRAVDYVTGDEVPQRPPEGPVAPLPDPSATRWNGPPPAGEAEKTGYWGVDLSRPSPDGNALPAPAPYRSAPPPCSFLEGAPSGVLTVDGQSAQYNDGVGFEMQNAYKFRISGTEFTGQTQMVQLGDTWYQAQWQHYSYEMNKIPVISGSGQIPALQLPIMSEANQWTPVSLGQIVQESGMYPSGTFYLPNAFGDPLQVVGGTLELDTPVVPVMTSGS